MPRPKSKHKHLPENVTVIHGAYWFRKAGENPVRIGAYPDEEHKVWAFMAERTKPQGPMGSGTTLKECFERYTRECLPKLAPRTQKDYRRHLAQLTEKFGQRRPGDVVKRDIIQYLDVPTGLIQANRRVAVLSSVYSKIVGRWGLAEHNPCNDVERNESHKRSRYVTDEEYDGLRVIASPRVRLAMELALLTGQRQGDLLNLEWRNVTPDGIRFQQGKTGKKLLVTRSPTLDAVLECARTMVPVVHIGGYVIRTRSGKPYTSEGFRACWQRTMAKYVKAGGERFTFHDLRAKSVSDSETLEKAFERAGHTTMAMTRGVYDRNYRKVTPLR